MTKYFDSVKMFFAGSNPERKLRLEFIISSFKPYLKESMTLLKLFLKITANSNKANKKLWYAMLFINKPSCYLGHTSRS